MNGDIAGDLEGVNSKLDAILKALSKNTSEDPGFMQKLKNTFSTDQKKDQEEDRQHRKLKQKKKMYQAIPIYIDGLTMEGKRDMRKALKDVFSIKIDTKDALKNKNNEIYKIILLITGLLLGAYLFFKAKLDQIFKDIDTAIKSLRIGQMINDFFSKIFNTEKLQKAIEGFKLGEASQGFKDFAKRFYALPEKYLKMNVVELEKVMNELQKSVDFGKEYKGFIFESDKKLINDLKELKNLKTAGLTTEEITKTVTETNKALERFQKIYEPFKAAGGALKGGFSSFITGVGDVLASLIKMLPFGEKFLQLGKVMLEKLPIVAVLIDTVESAFHLFDKAKAGKLGAEELTTTLTTLVLRAIGWLGSAIFFPLAFLRRENIETNIKGIFEEQDIMRKIIRMLLFPIDIIVKSVGETINFALNIPLYVTKIIRKITEFFTGEKQEKGLFEYFLESFMEGFKKDLENLNIATAVMDIGTKIGEWVVELFGMVFNTENLKKIVPFILDTFMPGLGTGAGKVLEFFKGKSEAPIKVQDAVITDGRVVEVSDQDQLLAMKPGGAIEGALKLIDKETSQSISELKATVAELSNKFDKFFEKTLTFYNNDQKMLNASTRLLQEIRDKEQGSSNVVVNNSQNSMIFSQKSNSNLEYRRDLANLAYGY